MTLTSHAPGTLHGELLDLLLATCVEPRTEVCRYCRGRGDGIVTFFIDQYHTRCASAECGEKQKALVHAVLLELAGTRCCCGKRKQERRTVCASCYRRLPRLLAAGLYAHFNDGYLENYAAARQFLSGRPVPCPLSRREVSA